MLRRAFWSSTAKLMADKEGMKQVIYTGPLNRYVGALKLSSLAITGATLTAGPIGLWYMGGEWHWRTRLALLGGMTAGTLVAFTGSHLLLRRYVFHINRILPPQGTVRSIGQERLEFVTLDPWCRLRRRVYSVEHLRSAWDSLGAWRPRQGGPSFILSVESMLASMPRGEDKEGDRGIVLDIIQHIQGK